MVERSIPAWSAVNGTGAIEAPAHMPVYVIEKALVNISVDLIPASNAVYKAPTDLL